MAPSFTPEWKFCTSQEALLLLIWKHLSNCIQTHICHFFRNHWQTICLERNKCWNNFKRKISQASHSLLIKKQKLILYNIYLSSLSKMFPTGRNKISKKKSALKQQFPHNNTIRAELLWLSAFYFSRWALRLVVNNRGYQVPVPGEQNVPLNSSRQRCLTQCSRWCRCSTLPLRTRAKKTHSDWKSIWVRTWACKFNQLQQLMTNATSIKKEASFPGECETLHHGLL